MKTLFKFKSKRQRYNFDTAAATPLEPEVFKAMKPFFETDFGNPSSIHREGVIAAKAMRQAREQVAGCLSVKAEEIIFTSGGTEANNLALLGVARGYEQQFRRPGRIVAVATEHRSVLAPLSCLASQGWEVEILPVNKLGEINLDQFKRALKRPTTLVSVSYVNNEIGTVFPLRELAKLIRLERKRSQQAYPLFHTDACQAPRFFDLDVRKLGVDMMTLNGSKIYGPKGSGLLYCRQGISLQPQILGGGQNHSQRSGTENVPALVGLSTALSLATKQASVSNQLVTAARDYLVARLKEQGSGLIFHGALTNRSPNNINFTVPGMEAEWLVIQLDALGFATSTGSACSTNHDHDQHVLRALYQSAAPAESSVRLSLDKDSVKAMNDTKITAAPPTQ